MVVEGEEGGEMGAVALARYQVERYSSPGSNGGVDGTPQVFACTVVGTTDPA